MTQEGNAKEPRNTNLLLFEEKKQMPKIIVKEAT